MNKQNDSEEVVNVVPFVETEELSPDEESDRLNLERKVERAFYEAGKALMELRDRRLYRSTHRTFEEYCRERFGHSRQKSNYLIAAANVFENLTTICCQNLETDDLTTNGSQILPTSEGQVRPLTKLEPQQQLQAWQQSVQQAGGKAPSGRIVKGVVERIMERTKAPNPYRVGEVCRILPKENPDLRGRGKNWCIVSMVGDFSCTVLTWQGELTVRIDHLQPLNYTDAESEQMMAIQQRISRLLERKDLEEAAFKVLQHLGEMKRPYLNPFEEKLLEFIEQEVGVE